MTLAAVLLKALSDFLVEFTRNLIGLLLIGVGIGVICLGAHWHMLELVTLGVSTLIPAALLALQSKKTPDGNTTTTQVTVPPPEIAPPQQVSNVPPTPPTISSR